MRISEVLPRYEQAELLKDAFLTELSAACGRSEDPLLEEFRVLGDRSEPLWYSKCALILHDLGDGLEYSLKSRIREIWQERSEDIESEQALGWAQEYFAPLRQARLRLKPSIPKVEQQLAACLLEHCFEAPKRLPKPVSATPPSEAMRRHADAVEVAELEFRANAGKAICVLVTVYGGVASILMKSMLFIPFLLAIWLTYLLISPRTTTKPSPAPCQLCGAPPGVECDQDLHRRLICQVLVAAGRAPTEKEILEGVQRLRASQQERPWPHYDMWIKDVSQATSSPSLPPGACGICGAPPGVRCDAGLHS